MNKENPATGSPSALRAYLSSPRGLRSPQEPEPLESG